MHPAYFSFPWIMALVSYLKTYHPKSKDIFFFPVIFKNSYTFAFHMQDCNDLLPHKDT